MKDSPIPFVLLCFFLLFSSCSDDDDGNSEPSVNLNVIGIWDLIEVNMSAPLDIDEDGTSSSNLIEELECISGTLLIDSDFSWALEQSEIEITGITEGLFFAQCSGSNTSSGRWTAYDTTILFQGSSQLDSLRISETMLFNDLEEDLPGIRSFVYAQRQ